jgi:hypothetical protein
MKFILGCLESEVYLPIAAAGGNSVAQRFNTERVQTRTTTATAVRRFSPKRRPLKASISIVATTIA